MRIIVILAMACITFAATSPVSAKPLAQVNCKQAIQNSYLNMRDKCGIWLLPMNAVKDNDKNPNRSMLPSINYLIANPQDTPATMDCLLAIKKYLLTCYPVKNDKAKYNPNGTGSVRAPVSTKGTVPPAGLLETTPSLTPQGPAAGGTPSRRGTVGVPQ
jgi:hypothetical protein